MEVAKRKLILKVLLLTLVILITLLSLLFYKKIEQKKKEQAQKILLSNIKKNYNKSILIIKDTRLFKKKGNNYVEAGKIYKDAKFNLADKQEFKVDDVYFKLENLDYYLYYKDLKPNQITEYKKDYQNYIPFNFDIITKNITNFYEDNRKILTINKSFNFEVIINDEDSYYVEFDKRLLAIKKVDVEKELNKDKKREVAQKIAVINYHFFFDPSKNEKCNQLICITKNNFEKHLKYLKDNGFYTASMNDVNLWLKKKIMLPKKTVVITIDDGAMGTSLLDSNILIPLLEKYDLHATLFLITAYWSKNNYRSPKLEIQSHGYDIHNHLLPYFPALRMTKEELVKDLKKSIELLDGTKDAFCYPFYAYNDTVLSAVKEAGFNIAFVGGNRKMTQNSNPYLLPRYVIYHDTSVKALANMVN